MREEIGEQDLEPGLRAYLRQRSVGQDVEEEDF